jgi:signal transduction histidine kinase
MTVKRRIALLVAGAGFVASLLFSLAVFFELVEQPFDLLDAGKPTRAFSNILDNAIKYNQDGGAITVEGARADGVVTLSVANSGPGVAEADIGKVFDQFLTTELLLISPFRKSRSSLSSGWRSGR